jgi:transmembrane sensor
MKPYALYTIEELAADDLFVRWVQHPYDDEVDCYWQQLLEQQPLLGSRFDEARALVLHLSQSLPLPAFSSDESATLWGRIRGSLQNLDDVRPLRPEVRRFIGWWYFVRTVAATVGIVLLIGWAVYNQYSEESSRQISTTTQPRLIALPDGSTVRLMPNSHLRYTPRGFDRESAADGATHAELTRAVWLDGTAEFTVVNTPGQRTCNAFRVHTDNLTAEATGTQFRVSHEDGQTRVALQEGQLNLLLGHQQVRSLTPGESVAVRGGDISHEK